MNGFPHIGRYLIVLPRLFLSLLLCGCGVSSEPPASDKSEPRISRDIESPHSASPDSASKNTSRPANELSTERSTLIRFLPLSGNAFPQVVPENGARHQYATILESLGTGGAAVDVDQDGLPDAIVAGGGDFDQKAFVGRPVYFLRNRGDRFADRTNDSGLGRTEFYNHGIAAADFDHDGFADLLITGFGGLQFFRNLGDGTFEEISASSQLVAPTWSASSAWGDFNRDGHLDLYVTAYVDWSFENDPPCYATDGVRRDNCSPKLFNALPDQLFLSDGAGVFVNATQDFGVRPDGKALGVVTADLDLDGAIDVYVGNDVMMNFLYRNDQGQRFIDLSISSGAGVSSRGSPDASMGVDVADYNLDGRPDIWAANFEMESFALYENQGSMLFRHMSESTGISAIGEQYVGWGSVFSDFDLDGDEDICVCNGNVVQYPEHSPALQRMLVMENVEGSYFEEVTSKAGEALMVPRNGRGLALIDWNLDGKPDILTTPVLSPAMILTNQSSTSGNWLMLRLIGTTSTRQPIGAIVEVSTSAGRIHRQLKGGGSYASTSQPDIHFAVPENVTVTDISIRWPAGTKQVLVSPELNRLQTVIEHRAMR